MPDMNDYHAFKMSGGDSNDSGGGGGGCSGCLMCFLIAYAILYKLSEILD